MPHPEAKLPDLLYIGDVPVEASYHGSALVYRLLQDYPPEKLRIIETNVHSSLPERRLAGVTYRELDMGPRRWLSTRFHAWVSSWFSRRARSRADRIAGLLDGFRPGAVLTVGHGYSWLTASSFARARQIPLHFIVHDDWPRQAQLPPALGPWIDAEFGSVYRQARSRLCVSRYMEESYRGRYGVGGSVLYPSRAANSPSYEEPPPRVRSSRPEIVFAFGGTVNTPGYVRALQQLAVALASSGARLNLYGPLSESEAKRAGLDAPNVRICGLVKAQEFIARMREDVDVLFLPMSFEEADRENMRLCFPSKLTDYTAAGLPILAYGPEDASGIRWARENPSSAEVVVREDAGELSSAVERLLSPSHRYELGRGAIAAGRESFSHERAQEMFVGHLVAS